MSTYINVVDKLHIELKNVHVIEKGCHIAHFRP